MEGTIRRRAYAKVNLALSVGPPVEEGPKRGFHPIATWMRAIELWDDVSVECAGESAYERAGAADAPMPTAIDWPIEKDLVWRAHRLMEREAGRALPMRVRVVKRIPAGAGLGGGSSDAAAMLVAVDGAYGLEFSAERMRALAMELGSDVAFFIDEEPPRPAFVGGFGDVVERVRGAGAELVLIVPPFACATGAVYGMYDRIGAQPLQEAYVRRLAERGEVHGLFNDLASAAERLEPRLGEIRRAAGRALSREVHVTGSGSAMFAIGGLSAAEEEELGRVAKGCVVVRTRMA